MTLGNSVIPSEIFLNIAQNFFPTPTHVQEIVAQDKRLLAYRLVCKQWEQFFNAFVHTRFDHVNFASMECLFVQKRHWDRGYFAIGYQERINYLKKLTLINNSQCALDWIENQKKAISDYSLIDRAQNSSNKDSIDNSKQIIKPSPFDWSIIRRLGYQASFPYSPPELSFQEFYDYLANGGFVCRELIPFLCRFFLYYLDDYIKNGWQKNTNKDYLWKNVFKQIYFENKPFFKQCLLNMEFTHFLAVFFCQMHFSLQCKHYEITDLLSKQVFKDLKDLTCEINYAEFIQDLRVKSIEHYSNAKHGAKIFFQQFRGCFTRNDFEGKSFLYYLLQYRLKYLSDNDCQSNEFFASIKNINHLILEFIREFKAELNKCSDSQKKEYCRLFESNHKFDLFEEELTITLLS
jgi:hypothetical protein